MRELSAEERRKASQCPHCGAEVDPTEMSCLACRGWSTLKERLDAPSLSPEIGDRDVLASLNDEAGLGRPPSRLFLLVTASVHLMTAAFLVLWVSPELDAAAREGQSLSVASKPGQREIPHVDVLAQREALPGAAVRDLTIALLLGLGLFFAAKRPYLVNLLGAATIVGGHLLIGLLFPDTLTLAFELGRPTGSGSLLVVIYACIWFVVMLRKTRRDRRHQRAQRP